jgi:AcrR family transcriptional regulator
VWRAARRSAVSETEAAVFAATDRLLERMPMAELSVAQIVKEADISRTTFYYNFTSKYAVIAALMNRIADGLVEPFEPLFAAASEGGEPTRDWRPLMEALARIYDAHGPILRAAMGNWHEVPELREVWLANIERSAQLLADLIDHQRASGIARPGLESLRLARTVVQAVQQAWFMAGFAGETDTESLLHASEPVFVMLNATLYGPE